MSNLFTSRAPPCVHRNVVRKFAPLQFLPLLPRTTLRPVCDESACLLSIMSGHNIPYRDLLLFVLILGLSFSL